MPGAPQPKKGRLGNQGRNPLRQFLGENDYMDFLLGGSIGEEILFNAKIDEIYGPVRGPLGFYKSHGTNALTDVYGNSAQIEDLLAKYGADSFAEHLPSQWIEDLTIAGTPEECADKIKAFGEAGADTVALFPLPTERIDDLIAMTAQEVLPLLDT